MGRPKKLNSKTVKVQVGCGKLYVTIGFLNNKPHEAFIKLGKSGNCPASMMEGMSRLIGVALNNNGDSIGDVIDALANVRCPTPSFDGGEQYLSCCDGIAKCIVDIMKEDDNEKNTVKD